MLEPVCIPSGSHGAEGRALRCKKGPWGYARGEGRGCLTAASPAISTASAPGHHTLSPQSILHPWFMDSERGKTRVQLLFALLQNPQAPGHLHEGAPSWPRAALPAGRSPGVCPGPSEQGLGFHAGWEVSQGGYRIPMFLHSTRNDLLKAQCPGLKHACPCPSH